MHHLLRTTVLVAVLVITSSTFSQADPERWERVYTGEDATIEMLVSSLKLQPEHILTVTFRTLLKSPQPLKKERPGTKYQKVIETIDFNSATKHYRYRVIRWQDESGAEVERYEGTSQEQWRPIKDRGMLDRMFELTETLTPFGTWRVREYRFAESGTQASSVVSAASKLLGTVARFNHSVAEFGKDRCDLPDYESKDLSSDDIVEQLGVQPRFIGIKTDHADTIRIKCSSGGWKPSQSFLIKLPEGGLLILWDGVFLVLEKIDRYGKPLKQRSHAQATNSRFVYEQGAIIRGDKTKRRLALVFTGDEFGEGAATITSVLKQNNVKASFFLTGRFYRNPAFKSAIQTLRNNGYYLGAHSNDHLLYCDWTNRNHLLITRDSFVTDLNKNYAAMLAFGISKKDARFFLPPFEWYNQTIADWTSSLGLRLINFTPGTGSNADYTTPDMANYISSEAIVQRIKEYERKDPAGLNGFILLMHIGAGAERTDKLYDRLNSFIDWLRTKEYELVRVDDLLSD